MELEVEDEGITGEEAKVKYGGRYEWFEPIIQERNEKYRSDWSPQAKRILTDYSEMRKAIKQVLDDIDERKTAAQVTGSPEYRQLSGNHFKVRLGRRSSRRQVFAGIGTKNTKVTRVKPRNMEELFGRAQNIDCEHWNQQ